MRRPRVDCRRETIVSNELAGRGLCRRLAERHWISGWPAAGQGWLHSVRRRAAIGYRQCDTLPVAMAGSPSPPLPAAARLALTSRTPGSPTVTASRFLREHLPKGVVVTGHLTWHRVGTGSDNLALPATTGNAINASSTFTTTAAGVGTGVASRQTTPASSAAAASFRQPPRLRESCSLIGPPPFARLELADGGRCATDRSTGSGTRAPSTLTHPQPAWSLMPSRRGRGSCSGPCRYKPGPWSPSPG